MNKVLIVITCGLFFASLLAACGGGGGGASPPPPPPADTTPPVISLIGEDPQIIAFGDPYTELGATASDNVDGDVTATIVIDASAVDTSTLGDYMVTYNVTDAAGNAATTVTRTVTAQLPVPAEPMASVTGDIKQLNFSWSESEYVEFYRLLENAGGGSGFSQVGDDIPAGTLSASRDIAVHLFDWVNAQFLVEACNATGCSSSDVITATDVMLDTIGYFKASNTEAGDQFGFSVALSGDGRTLAIGAPSEDSGSAGINGDQADNSTTDAGAAYVFRFDGSEWTQQAYIKASNPGGYVGWEYIADRFGWSIALSDDGDTLAVGAPGEDGDEGDPPERFALQDEGAVYIFRFDGTNWYEQSYTKGLNTSGTGYFVNLGDRFGGSVALSADGNRLAVGAIGHINSDLCCAEEGAAYVFDYDGTFWQQTAYIPPPYPGQWNHYGSSVALSADGDTLAISEPYEDSGASGINGDPTTGFVEDSGAVYLYRKEPEGWQQEAYFKPSASKEFGAFGSQIALAGDGNAIAVSAALPYQHDLHVFGFDGTVWNKQVFPTPDIRGTAAFTSDGARLAIGGETTGVRIFNYDSTAWYDQGGPTSSQGRPALSADGNTLAVMDSSDDSAATGINGDQIDASAVGSGAVFIY